MKTAMKKDQEVSYTGMINRMNLIFLGLLAGILSFSIVSIYLVESAQTMGKSGLDSVLLIVAPVLAAGCITAAYMVPSKIMKQTKNSDQEKKMMHYQSAYLIRYALLEGPGLFATVCYLMTGNRLFLLILAVLLGILLMNKPSLSRYKDEMGDH